MTNQTVAKQVLIPLGLSLALSFGISSCDGKFMSTQEEGSNYLKEQGFTQVKGGEEWDFWNGCGRGLSRDYLVAAKDSPASETTKETQRVCFGGWNYSHTKINP
tara:strand:- start:173656 stop:173967 length:312 start_codon:yes stop_codon:yes gene_type:complete